jgi:hypothetical protein
VFAQCARHACASYAACCMPSACAACAGSVALLSRIGRCSICGPRQASLCFFPSRSLAAAILAFVFVCFSLPQGFLELFRRSSQYSQYSRAPIGVAGLGALEATGLRSSAWLHCTAGLQLPLYIAASRMTACMAHGCIVAAGSRRSMVASLIVASLQRIFT